MSIHSKATSSHILLKIKFFLITLMILVFHVSCRSPSQTTYSGNSQSAGSSSSTFVCAGSAAAISSTRMAQATFFDSFNYVADRNTTDTNSPNYARTQFMENGWAGMKSAQTDPTRNPRGHLYTENGWLAMESHADQFAGQTDFWLEYGQSASSYQTASRNEIPGKVEIEFSYVVDPNSVFARGDKFIYPGRGPYPQTAVSICRVNSSGLPVDSLGAVVDPVSGRSVNNLGCKRDPYCVDNNGTRIVDGIGNSILAIDSNGGEVCAQGANGEPRYRDSTYLWLMGTVTHTSTTNGREAIEFGTPLLSFMVRPPHARYIGSNGDGSPCSANRDANGITISNNCQFPVADADKDKLGPNLVDLHCAAGTSTADCNVARRASLSRAFLAPGQVNHVRLRLDTSTQYGSFEMWINGVKTHEWIDSRQVGRGGVGTPNFTWEIPPSMVGGHSVARMPTTLSGGESKYCIDNFWMGTY